jgi:hypothetical protein
MISHTDKTEVPAGRASIWGAPYSGTPIRFDDLAGDEGRLRNESSAVAYCAAPAARICWARFKVAFASSGSRLD